MRDWKHTLRLCAVLMLLVVMIPGVALAKLTDAPRYAAIVVEAKTGEVLYARMADSERYPASITKVMTLYLAFDALESGEIKLTDRIRISKTAANAAPSKLGLRPGDTITVDQAIRAIAVKSANDIAVAMAEHLGGNERRFAALMTIKARELGMKRTRFVNASGLPDERQLSTARDIAILSRAVMRNHPKYYAYFSTPSFTWKGAVMGNHNRLLKTYKGTDGLKTGYTVASGFNLTTSAVRDGRRVIAVVLGGRTAAARDNHMVDLLDSAFALLDKRAKGERAAQMAAIGLEGDPDPVAAIIKASAEEGSNPDQRGVKIVLDEPAVEQGDRDETSPQFLPEPPVKKAAVAAKKPTVKTVSAPEPERLASLPSGDSSIQVGAFDSEAEAKSKLKRLQMSFGDRLALNRPSVVTTERKGKTYFRARFGGYTTGDAMKLCKALQGEGHSCFVSTVQ